MWDEFEASGRRREPAFHYNDLDLGLRATRRRLLELPVESNWRSCSRINVLLRSGFPR
jgi:hypothetical protein